MPLDNHNKKAAKEDDSPGSGENIEDNSNSGESDNNQVEENGPSTSKRLRLDGATAATDHQTTETKDNKQLTAALARRRHTRTTGAKIAFKSQFYPGPITFGGKAANCIPNFPLLGSNPGLSPLGGGQFKKPEENQCSEVNLTGLSPTAKKIYNMLKDQNPPSEKQNQTFSETSNTVGSGTLPRIHSSIADISNTAATFRQNPQLWNQAFNGLPSIQTVLTPTQRVPRSFLFDPPLPLPPAGERHRRIFTFEPPIGLEEDFMNYLNDGTVITNEFDFLFSRTTTEWECETCLIRNPESRQQCTACEASKPVPKARASAETPHPSTEVQLGLNLKKLSPEELDRKSSSTDFFPSPVGSFDFTDALKTNTISKTWSCCVCHAENNMTRLSCIFCETLKPQSSDSASDDD